MRRRSWLAALFAIAALSACHDWYWQDDIMEGDWGWDGEFEAGDPQGPIRISRLEYALEVWERSVSGCMSLEFQTDSTGMLTAAYRFVLPTDAVVHSAFIYLPLEERWEPAVTLGRREGQAVFEDIVQPRPPRDPLLLQQIGPDVYRARAYPVSLDRPLWARICYAHLLEPDAEGDQLRVPFVDEGDDVARSVEYLDVDIDIQSGPWGGGSWKSSSAESSGETSASGGHVALSHFVGDEDLIFALTNTEPIPAITALAYRPRVGEIDDHLHLTWQPDLAAHPSVAPQPRNVVFVVDVSGSMQGAKLEQAKLAVGKALRDLEEGDHFGLVAFDTEVRTFQGEMAGVASVAQAVAWVEALQVGNSTNIAAGLVAGAEIGAATPATEAPIDLMLMTDGRPTAGASTASAISAELAQVAAPGGHSVRVFSCGIGHDLDQELLNVLAHDSGGEATFALDDAEIADQFLDLFERVRGGGAAEVLVELEGGGIDGIEVYTWRRLFPPIGLSLAARGQLDGAVTVRLYGVAPAGETIELSANVEPDIGSEGEHLLVAPLAARAWSGRLERQIEERGEDPELVDAAVRLAKQYGILTRYSSLLALETEEMYAEHGIERLQREQAGIATVPVTSSSSDESRIGGEGLARGGDSLDAQPMAEEVAGCGCSSSARAPSATLGLILLVGLLWRRRRP